MKNRLKTGLNKSGVQTRPTENEMKKMVDNDKGGLYYAIESLLNYPWHPYGSCFSGTNDTPGYWQWAIVDTKAGLRVPVPLVKDDDDRVKLFGANREVELSSEAASLALAYYYLTGLAWLRSQREKVFNSNPIFNYFLSPTFKHIDDNEVLYDTAVTELYNKCFQHAEAKAIHSFID